MYKWAFYIPFYLTDGDFGLKTLIFFTFLFFLFEDTAFEQEKVYQNSENKSTLLPLHIFLLYVYLHTLMVKLTVNLP